MPQENTLYYGDNLDWLPEFADETFDLVYLDPPFSSNRDYNVLFGKGHGGEDQAQIHAFGDTWTWTPDTERLYLRLVAGGLPGNAADALQAMRQLLGDSNFLAYLVMMAPRLVELRRVLKATGSLYLHCDPTANHYLRVLLDSVFGPQQFRSEIVWRRSNAHNKITRQYGPIHDTILFYSKTDTFTFHPGRRPYTRAYIEDRFKFHDERGRYQLNYLTGPGRRQGESGRGWRGFNPTTVGRHWGVPKSLRRYLSDEGAGMSSHGQLEALYEQELIVFPAKEGGQPMYKQYVGPGVPYQDVWSYQPNTHGVLFNSDECIDEDVKWLEAEDEKLGFDTQKPIGLLNRILGTSTDPGDWVLDPFCGCGTTVMAAQALGRRWVGIDITYIAVDLIRRRLEDAFGRAEGFREVEFEVRGIPRDLPGAQALWNSSPFDFERWAVSLVYGQPNEKQVADKGKDGVIRFPLPNGRIGRAIVSVKGGVQLMPAMVDQLLGTVAKEQAEMGVLVLMRSPTRGMVEAANHSGTYEWPVSKTSYPRLQILTVEELLDGGRVNMPPPLSPYFQAPKRNLLARQPRLDDAVADIPESTGEEGYDEDDEDNGHEDKS